MISRKLRARVKLSRLKGYEIARRAGLHYTTLSRIINGIEPVKPGDARVVAIAGVLGLSEAEAFESDSFNSQSEVLPQVQQGQ